MGCIKVDDKLQKSEELSNFILFLFKENRIKIPKFSLFQILLSKTRPGLDSDSISSEILLADLFFVPLKSICSIKCDMPLFLVFSSLVPTLNQNPNENDLT